MNLNQLYYLQAIAQARGLTRAADALYVTQSNLSHSMAALEEELGIPFSTKTGGIPCSPVRAGSSSPTPSGPSRRSRRGSGWPSPGAAPPGARYGWASSALSAPL